MKKMPKFELSRLDSYDDHSLLAELKRVAALVRSKTLTQAEFDHHSKAAASVIRRRFGGWAKALALAGLSDRYSGTPEPRRIFAHGARTFADDELLAELRAVAKKPGKDTVTMEQFNQCGTMNPETIRRRFGSWGRAVELAGLRIANLGRRYSETDYFENLLKVWTHHGRQPKYGEMSLPPSHIRAKAYEAKWGRWRSALKAFLQRIDADVANSRKSESTTPQLELGECLKPRTNKHHDHSPSGNPGRREISLGLRYDVLRRDRFRCVICGASPATRIGCELHVDHIIPIARAGPTIIENLRTLCSECNVGKGPKLDEDTGDH